MTIYLLGSFINYHTEKLFEFYQSKQSLNDKILYCEICSNAIIQNQQSQCYNNHNANLITASFDSFIDLMHSMLIKEKEINSIINISLSHSLSREVIHSQMIDIHTLLRLKIYLLLIKFKETKNLNSVSRVLSNETKQILQSLHLYPLYQDVISSFIKDEINACLIQYQSVFDKSILVELIGLFFNYYLEWSYLNSAVPYANTNESINDKQAKENYKSLFIAFIKENYIKTKLEKFFDLISSYPESIPSLQDIKMAIDYFPQNEFVNSINKQTSVRLLTPGISTRLIIEIFIRIIKIMKAIEPSSYLLELISSPIKKYLRQRKDTMQWIITTILSEDDTHIMADMSKAYVRNIISYDYDYLSSDEDPENWKPINTKGMEGIEHGNDLKSKTTDIISTLVNIFGSPEKFMEQYKRMLSERKITDQHFSIENEIKNLELLKLKFGENLLQNCDVIIKDIKDSIKLNMDINDPFINCLVINKNYWPFNNVNTLFDLNTIEGSVDENNMPISAYDIFLMEVKRHIDTYKTAFNKKKFSRNISLYSNIGYVELTLTLNNEEKQCVVTPLASLIIQFFDHGNKANDDQCNAEFISNKLGADIDLVQKKINFWVTKGILKEVVYKEGLKARYEINTSIKNQELNKKIVEEDIYVFEYPIETINPKLQENAIISVIKNSGPKNFDQLYKNLISSYQLGISKIKLKDLLGKLILEQKLFRDGELYKIIIPN